MRRTQHRLLTTIPHGDPDIGAEVDCEIVFSFTRGSADYWNKAGGHWEQGWAPEVELVRVRPIIDGKPGDYSGAYADMEQSSLVALAESWLESDDGFCEACEVVSSDDADACEYAAELRADR